MLADITDIGVVLQTCPGIAHALPERRSQVDKVKAIERAITSDLSSRKTLEELSQEFEFPYASMQRCFKEVYGTSIHAYLTRYRMAQAATLLRTTSKPVGEVALAVGYANASKFASTFRDAVRHAAPVSLGSRFDRIDGACRLP